jgi:ribose-phosphate pyrophosphokinase
MNIDKMQIISFPDGQLNVINQTIEDHVECSLRNFFDVERLLCVVANIPKILRKKLSVNYLIGARSDRDFKDGTAFYLRDVIAPIINSLEYESVIILDPHSDVSLGVIKNSQKLLINWNKHIDFSGKKLVIPDAGAAKKDSYGMESIQCLKERDKSGKLRNFKVFCDNLNGADCIIIDDICDGGGTFIGIAQELRKKNCGKLELAVTHGIFSKGFRELYSYFDRIYTTNSFRSFNESDEFTMRNEKFLNKLNVIKL